jgi:hypothetical protein
MKNRMLKTGEILTIEQNIEAIEKSLGHPIPSGLVDPNSIKDHLLTTGEVLTICSNINAYDKARGVKDKDYSLTTRSTQPPAKFRDFIAGVIILSVICGLIMLIETIFGMKIL